MAKDVWEEIPLREGLKYFQFRGSRCGDSNGFPELNDGWKIYQGDKIVIENGIKWTRVMCVKIGGNAHYESSYRAGYATDAAMHLTDLPDGREWKNDEYWR